MRPVTKAMKLSAMMIGIVLVIGIPWISMTNAVAAETISTEAHEQSEDNRTSGAEEESPVAEPDLADIIPLASKLSGRLVALENRIIGLLDVSAIEKSYAGIEVNLQGPADQLERLTDSKDYKYNRLVELREAVKQESELFEEISKPLGQAIRQLGAWRKEWLAEKGRWNQWQSSMDKEGEFVELKSTFAKAHNTIDTALNLVLPQLGVMLTVQEKAGHIQAKIHVFAAELDGLLVEERRGALLNTSPPMFSSQYFSQFRSRDLWYTAQKGLDEISWPDSRFFARQGWIILIHGFISLFAIIAFHRNRRLLNESERWSFLAARPFSAGLFLGFMATVLIYEYEGAPSTWKLANVIVGGICFARLTGGLLEVSWKRQFVCGLVILLVAARLMDVLNFPLPFFRLYTFFAALIALLFCLRWAGKSSRHKDSGLYTWSLRLGSVFFAVIMIAEFWGKEALAGHLFLSSISSIATVLVFMLFIYMIRGGLEWLFRASPLRRAAVLHSDDTDAIIRRVTDC
jgi:potassium efflux system protein